MKHLLFVQQKRTYIANLLFVCVLMFFTNTNLIAQQKQGFVKSYLNKLLNDTTDISKPQLLIYPTLAYSPETSWEFGLSSLYVFYARRDTTNRLSEINGFTFYTLENQWGVWFDHALYSHKNHWFVLGRIRIQSFPLFYYGIGPNSSPDYLALVDANQIQIKERVLHKVYRNLYAGLEMDIQRLSSVQFQNHSGVSFDLPSGSNGSTNIGLGAGIIYDNRHNILNVRKGLFSELAMLTYDDVWTSHFAFTSIISDTRIYRPINKRDVFAAQVFGQFTTGDVPFNHLALLGGESIMRGYYLGRYRDRNLVASQIEYRFLPLPFSFTKKIGASVFLSSGTVFTETKDVQVRDFVLAGGAGLRYLLFPKKDIFTRLDVAFTREGTGFYIYIGEAF